MMILNNKRKFYLLIISVLILFLFSSCNYKVIVRSDLVIYDETGYLLIMDNIALFTESKDSIFDYKHVFGNLNRRTYSLLNLDSHTLKTIKSVSRQSEIHYFGISDIIQNDTIFYSYFRLRAYDKSNFSEKPAPTIKFSVGNQTYTASPMSFHKEVVYLYPALLEDQKKFNQFLEIK